VGTTTLQVVAVAASLLVARSAHADPCTGVTESGGRFATCFDLGNRLSVTAGSDGVGAAFGIRHEILFEDDPDLEWKMEHVIAHGARLGFDRSFGGTIYQGRYIRHARDGHIVIPLGTPKKVFLPFDIGALAEVGNVQWQPMDPTISVGVVRVAPLVDFARARNYRSLFAIGPVAHWDMNVDHDFQAVTKHVIAPFTEGMLNIHLESATGMYTAELRVEAGTAWEGTAGWKREARAEATLERIVLAINDRPISLTASLRYDSARDETIAGIGARFVIFDRHDPRVSLDPLMRSQPKSKPVAKPPSAPAPPPVPAPVPEPPPTDTPPAPAPVEDPPPVEDAPVEDAPQEDHSDRGLGVDPVAVAFAL
jgi:hypothetical protein